MDILTLARPLPLGRIMDALEQLPEYVTTAGNRSLVQRVAVAGDAPLDAAGLRLLADQAAEHGAQLLIVGAPPPAYRSAAEPQQLAVIGVARGTPAHAVSRRIRQLEHDSLSQRLPDEEYARSEIARLVDRAADTLSGHIIVEDRDFQILLYSRLAAPIDSVRRDAIMQQGMPAYLQQVFNSQGVQASLISGEDVVEIAPDRATGMGPRLVVAIRHRGRLVGTIWLARETPRFSPDDIATLKAAALQMSDHLAATLRRREDAQITQDDAALDLLAARGPLAALHTLGIDQGDFGAGAHVITFALLPEQAPGKSVSLSDFRVLVANSSWSVQNEAVAVAEGERLHIIHFGCGGDPECDAAASRLLASYFTENLSRVGIGVAVGIGEHAATPGGIAGSALSAGRVLSRRLRSGRAGIFTASELWAPLMLDTLFSAGAEMWRAPSIIGALLESVSEKDRELLATIHTALDHWGDIAAVARKLHVHHNTVRYRLLRFAETTGINLEDPETRLAVWLLLKKSEHSAAGP